MLIDFTRSPVVVELLPGELRVLLAWHDRQGDALDVGSGAPDREAKTAGDSFLRIVIAP